MSGSACESEPSLCDAGMIHHQNVSAAGPKSGTPYGLVNFAEPDVKVAFWEVLPRKRLLINEFSAAGIAFAEDSQPSESWLSWAVERSERIDTALDVPVTAFSPSDELCQQLVEASATYAHQLLEYAKIRAAVANDSDSTLPEPTDVSTLDLDSARTAILDTVRSMIHLFPAVFPDVELPEPVRITQHLAFTLPVLDFLRSRLFVEKEDKFFAQLARELRPAASAKVVHSGRGTLTLYKCELAIRVSPSRPIDPRHFPQIPTG